MKLLLDIGNTRLKAVYYDGSIYHGYQALSYTASGLDSVLDLLQCPVPPDAVYIANVAEKSFEAKLQAWSMSSFGLAPHFAHSQASFMDLRNGYAEPEQLGVDRWLAMSAARHLYAGPVCVADCGSALTIDLISADGQHLGGMILPGLGLQRAMLKTRLPQLGHEMPELDALSAWGQDTAECVELGLVTGLCGAIELAMRRAEACVPGARLIMTGGDGLRMAAWLRLPYTYHENLVLDGLALLATQLEGEC
jgi:type III pantothenate kinase